MGRKSKGCTAEMLFHVDIIAYVSRFVTLKIGDLLFTGTPEGVGPVSVGQHLKDTLKEISCSTFISDNVSVRRSVIGCGVIPHRNRHSVLIYCLCTGTLYLLLFVVFPVSAQNRFITLNWQELPAAQTSRRLWKAYLAR